MSSTSPSFADVVDIHDRHVKFLKGPAKVDPVPSRFLSLLQLLDLQGSEANSKSSGYSKLVSCPVSARKGINPFLIPIAENPDDKSLLSYIRWPTQKGTAEVFIYNILSIVSTIENMDLQLVRASADGMITLVSLGTDQYCHRIAVEMVCLN